VVVDENLARDHRRRRHAVSGLDERLDAVGRQDSERCALGRIGEGVSVLAEEQRPGDAVAWRCSQMAWVIARIWASVNDPLPGVPRGRMCRRDKLVRVAMSGVCESIRG